MTVTYNAEVATCTGLGCFWKLLFRWKGSIYKLLWPNMVVYVVLYYILYFTYKFALDGEQKHTFEIVCKYCHAYSGLIPLSFVLGFYVNLVVKRWQEMYQSIPSTDTLALFVSNSIHGQGDRSRLMRRTIMRYVNLSYVLTLSMISSRVKKRFPTLDHLVDAGVMLPNEKKIFDDLDSRSRHAKYWMPLVWAGSIIARARKESLIRDDFAVKTLLDELCNFRSKCGALKSYDWVVIPLVYTQLVTIAIYSFLALTLMGQQLVGEEENIYFPAVAFIEFFFYMGWLKVAEVLVNPFGEDDDDFETNWLIDRNLQVSYLIVDEMHAEHPELIHDQYWDNALPDELPHTVASQPFRSQPYMGSTARLNMTAHQSEIVLPNDSDPTHVALSRVESGVSIGRRKPSWASKSWKRSSVKSNRSAASEPYGINNSADPYTDAVDSKNDAMDPNKLTPPKVNIQIIKSSPSFRSNQNTQYSTIEEEIGNDLPAVVVHPPDTTSPSIQSNDQEKKI